MAEQSVTLQPGESKAVSFEATPHEVRTYHVAVDGLSGSFRATEEAVIGFTVTLINCPIHHIWGTVGVYFTDGTGALVLCGSPGSWTVETAPFNFSIAVYADTRGKYGYPDWTYLATYSFSAMVENGKDYIYDCATREFADITVARRVRAYWKMATGSISSFLRENGLTFNGKRAIDPRGFTGVGPDYALYSTFIIPIDATITQIEFKLLGVYGYYVCFDYKWTDQKPGGAEVTIAQGTKSPPYSVTPPYTYYAIPI